MYFSDVKVKARRMGVDDFILEGFEPINCTDTDDMDTVPCHYIVLNLRRQTGYFILQAS